MKIIIYSKKQDTVTPFSGKKKKRKQLINTDSERIQILI